MFLLVFLTVKTVSPDRGANHPGAHSVAETVTGAGSLPPEFRPAAR